MMIIIISDAWLYSIPYTVCKHIYMIETSRSIKKRINEHI